MLIGKLDHVNIRTGNLAELVDWYTTILGLRVGDRPDFPFPGAWLYAGEQAVVHLVAVDGYPGAGSESGLKLEHFALSATGKSDFEATLAAHKQVYETVVVQDAGVVQYNIWDPDGNHIHIDFGLDE